MTTIHIKHRYTEAVLFTYDVEADDPSPTRTALLAATRAGRDPARLREERESIATDPTPDQRVLIAVIDRELAEPRSGADLGDANLGGANLRDANLRDANLSDAYLGGANLRDANLGDANLGDADLRDANLRDANLSDAYLGDANLGGANLGGANLGGANLRDANLRDANLRDANLSDAYLGDANLGGANLRDANLGGANLGGANLSDANLGGANLRDANLGGANLSGANLGGANLSDANLRDANLSDAYLGDADLRDANNKPASLADHKDPAEPYVRRVPDASDSSDWRGRRADRMAKRAAEYRAAHPDVPVVEQLDARILQEIEKPGNTFDMRDWHGGESTDGTACGTTHCRAGWAIMLAGRAGLDLERKLGSAEDAGRAIYLASTGRAPYFFGSNGAALADMRRCAEEQTPAKTDG